MTTTSPSTRTRDARFWQPLGVVVLGFIVVLIFLVGDSGTAANEALGWAVGALVVVSLASGRPKSVSGTGPYALYGLGLLLSLMFSWSELSLIEVGRQALFLGLIFAVANLRLPGRMRSFILTLVLACTAVVVTLALTDPQRYRLEFAERMQGYQVVSQWGGYPEIGLLAALGAAATLAIFSIAPRRSFQVANAVLLCLFVLGAGLTFSRMAWVTIVIVSVGILASAWWRWRVRVPAVLLVALLAIGVGILPLSADRMRGARFSISDTTAVANRAVEWKAAIAMFLDRPLVGIGPGRYGSAFSDYSDAQVEPGYGDGLGMHAHSIVLHAAAELGLIGLVGLMAIWARVLRRTFVASGTSRAGVVTFAVHACLVALFVRSLGDNFFALSLATSLRSLLLAGVLFGLAESASAAGVTGRPDSGSNDPLS